MSFKVRRAAGAHQQVGAKQRKQIAGDRKQPTSQSAATRDLGEREDAARTTPGGRLGITSIRAVIAVIGLVVGWAVGYFSPGLWESAKVAVGQDPLAVTILPDNYMPWPDEHLGVVIVPSPLSRLPAEPDEEPPEEQSWTFSPNEVDAMTTAVRLIFTGTRTDLVTMQKLAVHVLARREPLRGIFVAPELGGAASVRYLNANLDTGSVTWRTDDKKPSPPLTLVLSRGEQEIVDLVATTQRCDCDWVLDVTYSVGSDTGVLTVPSKGHFRTSALSRSARVRPWTDESGNKPLCEDFDDLSPTLCDGTPPYLKDEGLKVVRHPRTGKYATGWGLAWDLRPNG